MWKTEQPNCTENFTTVLFVTDIPTWLECSLTVSFFRLHFSCVLFVTLDVLASKAHLSLKRRSLSQLSWAHTGSVIHSHYTLPVFVHDGLRFTISAGDKFRLSLRCVAPHIIMQYTDILAFLSVSCTWASASGLWVTRACNLYKQTDISCITYYHYLMTVSFRVSAVLTCLN